ncbi:MAG: hypothetical protein R2684_04000 [Pyrinomonadaceae bacterium]
MNTETITDKELALLRTLTVEPEWTVKFTELFDETVVVGEPRTITYINSGSGTHSIDIADKMGPEVEVFAVSETVELASQSAAKAETTGVGMDFSTSDPIGASDLSIADISLLSGEDIKTTILRCIGATNHSTAFFLTSSGSFGEVFSFLWEVLFELGKESHEESVAELIGGYPSIAEVEGILKEAGLKNIRSKIKNVPMDFASGKEFVESPLMRYFFLPIWLEAFSSSERDEITKLLAEKIDEELQGLSFRISVKAAIFEARRSAKSK